MPPSQTRSRSGCLTCKARRKKCDELQPFCQRCAHAGIQCSGYSYLGAIDDGKVVKRWTQPAYSMPPEQLPVSRRIARTIRSRRTAPHSRGSSPADQTAALVTPGAGPIPDSVSEQTSSNNASPDFSNSPFDRDPNLSSLITTSAAMENWWNLDPTPLLPSQLTEDLANTLQHPFLPPSISNGPAVAEDLRFQQASTSQSLTDGQASLFQALFSLSEPTNSRSLALSSGVIGNPPTSITAWSPPAIRSHMDWVDPDDEIDEDESVKQIIYGTMTLDMNAEGNVLPYVLESYAAWITRTAFEPKKAAPGTRDLILKQFSDSADSRWTVTTLAQVVRTLADSATWGDGLDSLRNLGCQPAMRALRERVHQNVNMILSHSGPLGEQELSKALKTIGNVMEIASIYYTTTSLLEALEFMGAAAPLFRFLCPDPPDKLIHLQSLLLQPIISLRHYAIVDIFSCVAVERNMLFHYDSSCDANLSQPTIEFAAEPGLQWLHGIPNTIVIAFARINMLREQGFDEPQVVAEIESMLRCFVAIPSVSSDPFLTVARVMVQECWRQAAFIYLYMAACNVNADDARVKKALSRLLKLLDGTKQGHTPDAFLMMNCMIGGIAARNSSDRQIIRRRMINSERFKFPGAQGNVAVMILEYLWLRSDGERRPAVWRDWQIATRRATRQPSGRN
ncbi:fungal-specific transcription factor domain protein [Rhizoctonia solani 123E]|uniref:Fungal-specific transcription factor domain protein n=1 Tax=Rhizoctonia solani 123E TaxID=1423351 RepID=A0A074S0I5_9AGAM|nr:fungal-specific transcription factor domain protein [Rhizoctonia solani 123E]